MASESTPDLSTGVAIMDLPDGGMIQGTVAGEDVVLARSGEEYFAVGATCTHYGGPLVKGLIVGGELRCPLHHACFSLRSGQALRPPAFDPIPRWRTERVGDKMFVREKLVAQPQVSEHGASGRLEAPTSILIVGGGAAGFSAADTLRKEGYKGPLTLLSADDFAPYDRPNLSKEYLAGKAPEEWIPLRPPEYYKDRNIDLVVNAKATSLEISRKEVQLASGRIFHFDRLLLATGAEPVRIAVPGAAEDQLLYLRTFADCRLLIARAASAKQVVVLGGGFIGLEVAASLRELGIGVHVVLRDQEPLERVLGPQLGQFVRHLHEQHGVVFHTGDTVSALNGRQAHLRSGTTLEADFLVVGVGVRPSSELATTGGLRTEHGVVVNEYLETSAPGIFAAGDATCWPDPRSGQLIRIEHWVVAERQGQVAARNLLGHRQRFRAVPFFWTRQFGVSIKYVGFASTWSHTEISGDLNTKDCAVRFMRDGEALAVATISRDRESLQAEVAMEALANGFA
jgi:NADPH-dependent 2,4-dienoyl-CoA reductase/sulfur reductase-like enzyme/nitrite reductase/ring-hydroxylating ferredoxin subunit